MKTRSQKDPQIPPVLDLSLSSRCWLPQKVLELSQPWDPENHLQPVLQALSQRTRDA